MPDFAKKEIKGGRLNGMTDIKPIWRIEVLTDNFGPCGKGWKTKIINKSVIEGANGEKIVTMDIQLFVKYDGEWSEPIEGTGGSSFIAKEKNGLYTSDECFKMAYTDALSVACRSLGIGADVYWGDNCQTKYSSQPNASNNKTDTFKKATELQIKMLKTIARDENIFNTALKEFNYERAEDILIKDVNSIKSKIELIKAKGGVN